MSEGEFHTGGHLPPDSSAYVARAFVDDCFEELSRGRWVVLLGPRQHGKTSGLVRLLALLRHAQVKAAHVSLQGIPRVGDYPQLLQWIASKVARQFGVQLVPPSAGDARELDAWLAAALPVEPTPIAILLDEAAGVQDAGMRSDFYRQLRRLHDERDAPVAPNLGRSFALLFSGTFEPKRLVADDLTSPFNVSQRVESADLSLDDARTLVEQVGASQAAPFVDRAFDLVAGQPLLLQQLFAAAERGDDAYSAEERYDFAERRLLVGDSDHLSDLISTVVNDPALRVIAERMLQDPDGAPFAATPDHRMLVTVGLARLEAGRLLPRNSLYAQVASQHPLLSGGQSPPAGVRIAPFGSGAFDFVTDVYLRAFAEETVEGAYVALNGGHLRLALIGLGSALEAILIDALEQASQSDRDTAVQRARAAFRNPEIAGDPSTWRLVTLIKVADKLAGLDGKGVQAAHAIRELRNLVHPAIGRAQGQPQSALKLEFEAAQAVLGILVRELS